MCSRDQLSLRLIRVSMGGQSHMGSQTLWLQRCGEGEGSGESWCPAAGLWSDSCLLCRDRRAQLPHLWQEGTGAPGGRSTLLAAVEDPKPLSQIQGVASSEEAWDLTWGRWCEPRPQSPLHGSHRSLHVAGHLSCQICQMSSRQEVISSVAVGAYLDFISTVQHWTSFLLSFYV